MSNKFTLLMPLLALLEIHAQFIQLMTVDRIVAIEQLQGAITGC
jgi:hypothetical protein